MKKVLFCWSSGKDSAMALWELMQSHEHEVVGLLTTITEAYDRISMHGVRRVLVEQQAESIGLPLEKVLIPTPCSNEDYEYAMRAVLEKFKKQGVSVVAFGDIFLEDVKQYREERLAQAGMKAIFPLWKRDTRELAQTFTDQGFKAIVTCVDTRVLDSSFSGRDYGPEFIRDLPGTADPCGENGEFHSFTHTGPMFRQPISCTRGETVLRDGRFCFTDVIPG